MNNKKYAIKVNGSIVSPPVDTSTIAENYIKQLSPEHQSIAEVVIVDDHGKEFLFG